MDVYRTLHPSGSMSDDLELETWAELINEKYNVDMVKMWDPEMTLGDVFELTREDPNKPFVRTSSPWHDSCESAADGGQE